MDPDTIAAYIAADTLAGLEEIFGRMKEAVDPVEIDPLI
jgi:hypothetical protein